MLLIAAMLVTVGVHAATDIRRGAIERGPFLGRAPVQEFIDTIVQRHSFDRAALVALFAGAQRQNRVLELVSKPAEGKPWREYRQIFLTPERAREGVKFWQANEDMLERAQETYGVAPEVIVAIIGVETYYGRQTGGFDVFDTLATLGFDYPPRGRFFLSELEQFLLLTREEAIDPASTEGSYAGAMGKGQFISSSYRAYAVDFDEDGKRDLWSSNADAIGSVANYFKRHGWREGAPVVMPAKIEGNHYKKLLDAGLKPKFSQNDLRIHGVKMEEKLHPQTRLTLVALDGAKGREYWVGLNNFYVITRYNHSPRYAMAVHQLGERLKKLKRRADEADARRGR
ncbi:MAG: lytic murein transglycosylase B [Gammaproteobacteria bacterium]